MCVHVFVYFGSGSKVTTKVSPLDTTSDLLESIKDQLTSSSTQLWLIDQSGVGKTGSLHGCIAYLMSMLISYKYSTCMRYATLCTLSWWLMLAPASSNTVTTSL